MLQLVRPGRHARALYNVDVHAFPQHKGGRLRCSEIAHAGEPYAPRTAKPTKRGKAQKTELQNTESTGAGYHNATGRERIPQLGFSTLINLLSCNLIQEFLRRPINHLAGRPADFTPLFSGRDAFLERPAGDADVSFRPEANRSQERAMKKLLLSGPPGY